MHISGICEHTPYTQHAYVPSLAGFESLNGFRQTNFEQSRRDDTTTSLLHIPNKLHILFQSEAK